MRTFATFTEALSDAAEAAERRGSRQDGRVVVVAEFGPNSGTLTFATMTVEESEIVSSAFAQIRPDNDLARNVLDETFQHFALRVRINPARQGN